MQPTVSVITPVLAAGPAALDSIASVARQRPPGLDQIVIGAAAAVRGHLPSDIDATAIRWIEGAAATALGLAAEGLAAANGDAVSWLFPGDLHFDDTLAIVARGFASDPSLDVVYGDAIEIDAAGRTLRPLGAKRFSRPRLFQSCFFSQPTAFVRRSALARVGGLDERQPVWADYDLWLRLAAAGGRFGYLPRLLAAARTPAASSQPFRFDRAGDLVAAEELVDLLGRRTGTVPGGEAAALGLRRALRAGADSRGRRELRAAAYREACEIVRGRRPGRTRLPWESLALARHTASVVRHHVRHGGDGADGPVAPAQQLLRPKRFQMLRRRIHRLVHHAPRPLAIPADYPRVQPPADPPVISIVTPSYNQADYLEATLRSVLDQGYPRLEYIVQDGGSTDGSVDLLHRYSDRLTAWDSRRDGGQAAAINVGMQRTTGGIMAYLNSDDLLLPGSLASVARYFADHPEVDVVYGHRVLIDDHGREIGRWVLPPHDDDAIRYTDFIPQETMFWRRRAWEAVGARFDESFRFALDWDIILRFRAAGLRFARLPRFLGAFRITLAQKTNSWWLPIGRREVERLTHRALGFTPDSSTLRRRLRPYMWQHFFYDKLYLLGVLRY